MLFSFVVFVLQKNLTYECPLPVSNNIKPWPSTGIVPVGQDETVSEIYIQVKDQNQEKKNDVI